MSPSPSRCVPLGAVGWVVALWPMVTVALCYGLSIRAGDAPACMPFVDGCTSISRAARHGAANHVFKLSMLPYVPVLAGYWWLAGQWSRQLAPARRGRRAAMLAFGWVGALFLALYVRFLGLEGEAYQLLRRYGINLYFAGTVVAQMLLASQMVGVDRVPRRVQRAWRVLCGLLLLLGLASLPLQYVVDDRGRLLNAIEWQYALLMAAAYPLTGLAWHRTGFVLTLGLKGCARSP